MRRGERTPEMVVHEAANHLLRYGLRRRPAGWAFVALGLIAHVAATSLAHARRPM